MLSRLAERLAIGLSIGVLIISGYVIFRGDSPLRESIRRRILEHRIQSTLRSSWSALAESGARIDSTGSEVRIVEFSDYACPYCRRTHAAITEFVEGHPTLGIVYRHLPLPIHPAALGAARAAICAEAQGRFREMHRRLFETSTWRSDQDWEREARLSGVPSLPAFLKCLDSPATAKRLQEDASWAAKLAISGTPSFATASGVTVGEQTADQLGLMAALP